MFQERIGVPFSPDYVNGYVERFEFTVSFLSFVDFSLCIEILPDDLNVFQHKSLNPSVREKLKQPIKGGSLDLLVYTFYFERNPFMRKEVLKPENV